MTSAGPAGLDPDRSWAHLGPKVRRDTLRAMDQALPRSLRTHMSEAGFQYRQPRQTDRVSVRGQASTRLFRVLALQRADGSLRGDAGQRLRGDTLELDWDIPAMLRAQPGYDGHWRPTTWTRLWLEFLQAEDPLAVLQEMLDANPDLRFHRLVTPGTLALRRVFLRYLEHIMTGGDPSEIPVGNHRRETARTEGLFEVGAAPLLIPPLMARYQPVAAVLTSKRGAQVAVTLHQGHMVRPFFLEEWPVGMTAGVGLEGDGRGLYTSEVTFPAGWSADALEKAVKAADRFLGWMTDPARWQTDQGSYDHVTRRLTWASIVHGLGAVTEMAKAWSAPHALWDAFRALGTLQGIWEGRRQASVRLSALLDPRRVRDHAVRHFPDEHHRRWASDVVDNYQQEIRTLSPSGELDDAIQRIEELRHLQHGVQAQGRRSPTRRLETLDHMDRTEAGIQLVRDIAAFWWTAVIIEPEHLCRPGAPPWE